MKDSIINKKMEHTININNFEGPLDLLLYLICKNKMDIFDISLSELTDEYIMYLNQMYEMDVEIATEFILMASTLLEIKSRKLLPKKEEETQEELTEEQLMMRLIEYKKYKEYSLTLKKLYDENFGCLTKIPEKIQINKKYSGEKFDVHKIKEVYLDIILRNMNRINLKSKEIEKIALYERITVKDKTKQIVNYLKDNEQFVFNDMFNLQENDKLNVVTAFLGTLELSKEKQITLSQYELFSDIYVKRNSDMINYEF